MCEDFVTFCGYLLIWKLKEQPNTHTPTVSGLLQAISKCRLVITSSYHGAVLALGQGIPAVCYFKTEYYRRKFSGLAEMFPGGCKLLDLSGRVGVDEIHMSVEHLLGRGDELRPSLLRAGLGQVEAARRAYERLPLLFRREKE